MKRIELNVYASKKKWRQSKANKIKKKTIRKVLNHIGSIEITFLFFSCNIIQ
jgi:hypothetical protein